MYSKKIEVDTRKINATVTQEQIDDLKNFGGKRRMPGFIYYEYKLKNENDLSLLEKYSDIVDIDGDYIIYSLSKKQARKLKLKNLEDNQDPETIKIKDIISKSEIITSDFDMSDMESVLVRRLSREMSKSINAEIVKKLQNLPSDSEFIPFK